MAQQIVHNTGVNYSLYYNVLNYFKTIMKNHPSIQSVTYGDVDSIDDKQYPEYPLGNVLITDSRFETSTTTFTVQLTIADKQKNLNNESSGSTNAQTIPFYGVDDMVDIHANTLSILNDLTAYTQRGVQGFEVNGDIICTPFSDRFNNGLAGWVANFELTTHNDKNRCLFFLVNPSGSGYLIEECDMLGKNCQGKEGGYSIKIQSDTIEYIKENWEQLSEITPRVATKIADMRNNFPSNWKTLVKNQI